MEDKIKRIVIPAPMDFPDIDASMQDAVNDFCEACVEHDLIDDDMTPQRFDSYINGLCKANGLLVDNMAVAIHCQWCYFGFDTWLKDAMNFEQVFDHMIPTIRRITEIRKAGQDPLTLIHDNMVKYAWKQADENGLDTIYMMQPDGSLIPMQRSIINGQVENLK